MTGVERTALRPGRPSTLTPEVHDRIVHAVRGGSYLDDAAGYAGVPERTLYHWLRRGRDAEAKADRGDTLTDDEQTLLAFQRDVTRARADATIRNVSLVQVAAQDTWQAAAWWLERTNPRKWGRHETVEVVGDLTDNGDDYRQVLDERIARLRERTRQVIDVPVVDVVDVPDDPPSGLTAVS